MKNIAIQNKTAISIIKNTAPTHSPQSHQKLNSKIRRYIPEYLCNLLINYSRPVSKIKYAQTKQTDTLSVCFSRYEHSKVIRSGRIEIIGL